MKKKIITIVFVVFAACLFSVACDGGDGWSSESVPEHEHAQFLTKVDAKDSTCIETGNIEFYLCSCGEIFSDNSAQVEITDESEITIEKKAHTLNNDGVCIVCGNIIGISYILSNDNTYYSVSSYSGESERLRIPESYNGLPIKGIGDRVFYDNKTINEVIIPSSVTSIGEGAFQNCGSLARINIPDCVVFIGESAFLGCNNLIVIDEGVHYVGNWVVDADSNITTAKIKDGTCGIAVSSFCDCFLLTSVTIPDSVALINERAFLRCAVLTSVTIGSGVTSIGSYAFYNCSALTSVNYTGTIDQWVQIDFSNSSSNPLYYAPLYYAKKLYINNELVTEANITNATKINDYAFDGCSLLTSVTIGDSVTSIGERAFWGCSVLTSVTIGDSVTSIGDYAFYNCESLTSVTIGNGVTSIGSSAFGGCYKLVEVINKSKLYIMIGRNSYGSVAYYALNVKTEGTSEIVKAGDYLFYTASGVNYLFGYTGNQTDLVLPDNYNNQNYEINQYAFYHYDSLTSVTIPDSVTSIGDDAFDGCYKLVEVINKSSLNITKGSEDNGKVAYYALNIKTEGISEIVKVGDYLFYTADGANYLFDYTGNETALVLPDNYNNQNYKINQYAFYNCRFLTSITIPDSVTSIGESAFYNCSALASVTIPDSITSIGEDGFDRCYSLTSVNYTGTIDQWVQIDFDDNSNPLDYAEKLYINNELVTEANITTAAKISNYAFFEYELLTSVTIGNSVTSIGNSAFDGCSSLTSVTIHDSVISIGWSAFSGCSSLTSVAIGNGVTLISWGAFDSCYSLTSVTIPDSVTSIGGYAFDGCSSLTSVTIPDSAEIHNLHPTNNYGVLC